MVGHLTPGVTDPVESRADLLKDLKPRAPVSVVKINRLPSITPGSDVIKTTSQFDAKRTRHDIRIIIAAREGKT
jgi:hypothetical protein